MFFKYIKLLIIISFFFNFSFNYAKAETIKEIQIQGNERISKNTILMFAEINENQKLEELELNLILKKLYNTNFFENIKLEFDKNVLKIFVKENPIIEKIVFTGIKADKIKKAISENLTLKSRSSFNEVLLKNDKQKIELALKNLGYFFSEIDIYIENLNDNKIILNYKVDIGEKSKIKKISFIGPKIYKDNKLRSIIVSEEYKFWKFISGKKFLNENTISLDKRLLKNFYLSKGYYDVEINSSFAKLINENEFELIFSINPKEKIFFNNISLNIPLEFDENNFKDLSKLFNEIKGKPYSLNYVSKILDEIDKITTNEEFHSIKSTVDEEIIENKINLNFNIVETTKFFVEKINIFGNSITRETVIRNNLEIDEGDPYNEILSNKSINNLKSLNFFKSVESEVVTGSSENLKVINYTVDEKPTGEISAGAGVGTSGGSVAFSVKENNYLGKGISVEANTTLTEESVKGLLKVTNPNYNNTDNSLSLTLEATEIDRLKDFGYKNDKFGYLIGTQFELLNDLDFGLSTSSYYEKVETNSTASARQKKLAGNYWDTFLNFSIDYDKRNQMYQTTEGFRSRYFLDLPVISDTNTLTNTYEYKYFTELFDENISTASIYIKTANSLSNDDIKLSERLYVPSSKLRGFERGKIGPLDNGDYVGGNYVTSINFSSTIPQILENAQDLDVGLFLDAANVWGVDYDSSLDNSEIRSAIGIGVDWFTFLGPLNFTLALPLTKEDTDKTETFRFNIGTTF